MRPRRNVRRAFVALTVAALAARGARAQQAEPLMRGFDLEQQGKLAEAAAAYRAALAPPNTVAALLGLERALVGLGLGDSLLPIVDSLARERPREATFRNVQLRTLVGLDRMADARAVLAAWTRALPGDPVPYREYTRLLLQQGRIPEADSVLREAQQATGGGRELALEIAQLRAAMGLWEPAARAWRAAYGVAPYVEQAATYALAPAPADVRPAVRAAFLALPLEVGARRILAALEASWGSPRAGWEALRVLPADSAAAAAWRDFALRAEAADEWLVARDALMAALRWRPSSELSLRAATAALNAGDAAGALLLAQPAARGDSVSSARAAIPLQVRALAALGRAAEAERLAASYDRWLDHSARLVVARALAWGWIRAGDMPRARAALAAAGDEGDSTAAAGWLALYDGDLRTARGMLRRAGEPTTESLTALARLSRTRLDSSRAVGGAFLALARGDTAGAAAAFEMAASELGPAAPLVLMTAAQLRRSRGAEDRAVALWERIVREWPDAPEAAEADLEWARALRRRGDHAGAASRLEHLILTYPRSALVPQARRELDLARGAVPGRP
ncbi:MAG TPA: hypothetical protein VNA89_01435 [Gemmatimonadaceae bacterium]|nr:hypothetical protein [Gemmatimonadaceae bacterium]